MEGFVVGPRRLGDLVNLAAYDGELGIDVVGGGLAFGAQGVGIDFHKRADLVTAGPHRVQIP